MTAAILILAGMTLYPFIKIYGTFPWGSDTWGHLLKVELLADHIRQGDFYPQYMAEWYNGSQLFRYWAPLPYYFLYLLNRFTPQNVFTTFWLFGIIYYLVSAGGWLLFSRQWGWRLSLLLGIFYASLADNLRVLFSEGNLPRIFIAMLFPYVLFVFLRAAVHKKRRYYPVLALLLMVLVLSHAMIAAMVMIVLGLIALVYGILEKRISSFLLVVFCAVLGVSLAGWWFLPSLTGGITALDTETVLETMKNMAFFPISVLMNPLVRLHNREAVYFMISLLVVGVLAAFKWKKMSRDGKAVLITALILTLSMLSSAASIYTKLPLADLIWSYRFLPFVGGLLLYILGMLIGNRIISVRTTALILVLLMVDLGFSMHLLVGGRAYPADLKKSLQTAADYPLTSLMDKSSFGSAPTYFLSRDLGTRQVFGWAWQGAQTGESVMFMNTAFDKEWYGYMFDRNLQAGAGAVFVRKDLVTDKDGLLYYAGLSGYRLTYEDEKVYTFTLPNKKDFGTAVHFRGLAIGRFAGNAAIMFPSLTWGESNYLDDYTFDKLKQYTVIILSGFQYRDLSRTENMLKQLAASGTKVIVDMIGLPEDLFSGRSSFMGVQAETLFFSGEFPTVNFDNKNLASVNIPESQREWQAFFLRGLDQETLTMPFAGTTLAIGGIKDKVYFLGGNLVYLTFLTHDRQYLDVLGQITGLAPQGAPDRTLVPLQILWQEDKLQIRTTGGVPAGYDQVVLPVAKLDVLDGNIQTTETLAAVSPEETEVTLKISLTKVFQEGKNLSILAALVLVLFTLAAFDVHKGNSRDRNQGEPFEL